MSPSRVYLLCSSVSLVPHMRFKTTGILDLGQRSLLQYPDVSHRSTHTSNSMYTYMALQQYGSHVRCVCGKGGGSAGCKYIKSDAGKRIKVRFLSLR